MSIVGGLDIHRKQITFDYHDTETGEVGTRPDLPGRPRAPAGLAGPVRQGREMIPRSRSGDAPVAVCRGGAGRGRGHGARWPAGEAALARVASGTARPTGPMPGAPAAAAGRRLAEAAVWTRPGRILKCRPCSSLHDLRGRAPRPGCSGSTRCLFRRAPRRWARARCAPSRAWPAAGRVGCRPPALAPASCRRHRAGGARCAGGPAARGAYRLLDAARHLAVPKVLAARLYGVGPFAALAMTCCWAGRPAPPPARRSGSPGWTHRVVLEPQGTCPGGCPGRDRRCCVGGV